jgi:DNA-binding phage protein
MTNIKVLDREDIKNLVEKAGSVFNLSKSTGVREVSLYRYLNGTVEPTLQTQMKLNQFSEEVEYAVAQS